MVIMLFMLLQISVDGQKVFQPKQIDYNNKGIVYKTERTYDFKIHTYGFAVGMTWGEIKTYYKTKYYSLELGMIKHPKERLQNKNVSFENEGTSNSFAYAKRNSLFVLRGGVGEKRYLTEKTRRKGASIGINYEGGVSIGLLKPYYIKSLFTNVESIRELRKIKFTEENREQFLNYDTTFGGAGFFHGITGTTIRAGVHGKLGLQMALGAFDKNVKALEAGVMVDLYPTKVPIMVEIDELTNSRYFLNLYLTLQIGKRK